MLSGNSREYLKPSWKVVPILSLSGAEESYAKYIRPTRTIKPDTFRPKCQQDLFTTFYCLHLHFPFRAAPGPRANPERRTFIVNAARMSDTNQNSLLHQLNSVYVYSARVWEFRAEGTTVSTVQCSTFYNNRKDFGHRGSQKCRKRGTSGRVWFVCEGRLLKADIKSI